MDVKNIYSRLVFSIPLCIIASVVLQSVFLWIIKDNPNNFYDGNFVSLWTHDAGLYGHYAKELLNGASYPFVAEYMPGWLLYFISTYFFVPLNFSLFYAPVVISSLVVIPLIFTFRLFNLEKVGFFAGLLTTVGYGYYYRSFFGYYDTDILNLFFPLIIILGFIGFSKTSKAHYVLLSALGMLGFSLWYHSFAAIGISLIGAWIFYALFFKKEELSSYLLIAMMAITFLHVSLWIKICFIVVLFLIASVNIKIKPKYLFLIFTILLVIGLFFVDINIFFQRAMDYIDKNLYIKSIVNFKFLNALNSVGEAGSISFENWSTKIASNLPITLIGGFGFILLCIKHKSFFLFIPLLLIALLAMVAGERFIMFGIPVFSIGIIYFIHELTSNLPKFKQISFLALIVIIFFFYMEKIINLAKQEAPVFNKQDLQVLSKLKKDKNNFILTWWDYGWPLWYETGAKTLIDNGKHFEDNFIISKLLFTSNQQLVANVSKQSVRLFKEANKKGYPKLMPYILKTYKPKNASLELSKPSKPIQPIYWYLNNSLLSVGATIKSFSDIDIATGKKINSGLIMYLQKTKSIQFNKNSGIISINGQKFTIQSYTNTQTKKYKKYKGINIQFIETKTNYIVCTSNVYNSFLIQALVFKNIDTNAFEIISSNDTSILLRVK